MKNNDYKKIVNGIKIPEQKLDLVKNSILQKKSICKFKYATALIVIAAMITGTIYFRTYPRGDNETKTLIDVDYFITNIYANDETYELTDDKVSIDMSSDMFGTTWRCNAKRSCLPFDIRIVGENIKSISYSVIKGTSLDFYRVKSLDLFHDDLSELNKKNDFSIQFKMFNELRDQDKELLKERYQLTEENLESYVNDHIINIIKDYRAALEQAGYSQESLNMYGGLFWIEINQGDRMTVPYDQQDPLNYRNILYTELNLENKDISVIDNEQIIYQTVKQELLSYEISMAIEYNNGVIKEKIITFEEGTCEERNNECRDTIYMKIK